MKIGIPSELKDHEYRVGMTPASARTLVDHGHQVFIQSGAGAGSSFEDEEYVAVGVEILPDADSVWATADMIIKVKEPIAEEFPRMRSGQILFTYLHLAPLPELTEQLTERGVIGIAYETVTDDEGRLPLLTPMSEVAGRMSVLAGATYLQRAHGGRGILLSGVPGVLPADVLIIGGGIVGINAAKIALGMGARVTVLERSARQMRYLDDIFGGTVNTLASNRVNLEKALEYTDVLIGAVLVPGRAAPKLVNREMLRIMKKGTVAVDVAVDQGGCFETTRPTTHSDPIFVEENVVHYCVANMPGAVPRTSTMALTNATLPYALDLANKGFEQAVRDDSGLWEGVNTYAGAITYDAVAESQGRPYRPLKELL
ncbi:MAG: alanine dehydrogenase [Acidobacteriota bacterium]